MEGPLWDRIQEIYHSALPLAPAERSAFVESACAQDSHLMREVKSLLDADQSSGDFLESSVFDIGLKIITSSHSSSAPRGDDSSMDDLIGTTIDRYLVEKKLGEGGMGTVYLARELSLHSRPVVIKILSEASLQSPYLRQKFEQEIEALARLNHPNVVSVLGDGELSGKPYIVMQYVSGLTLRSQIPNEGMNLQRAASILKQIGAALDYVHEQGIFHRDLKPDNIMLQQLKGGTEFVMVVDFGIAKVKDSVVAPSTADNIAIGTAHYMSPEQLRGGEKITAASDVYSMAVMAYEMVTGRRPFNPTSTAQLLELQRNGVRVKPADLRANLSTQAQAILLRGLSFERTARYQDAVEFCNSLARALMKEEESDLERIHAAADLPKSRAAVVKINGEKDGRSWWRKRFTLIGSLAVVLSLAMLFAVVIRKGQSEVDNPVPSPTPTPTPLPTRSLVYWLEVQTMQSGKARRNFFQSTNQDVFETGDKFRLNVSCPEPGYVYVFNEGTPEPRNTSFTIIYPTPETNNGSASIGKNQPLQTNWNTFRGRAGTENFWIVWSTLPVSELESAKIEAFKHRDGGLTGETLDAVKKFLTTKAAEVNVKTSRDKQAKKTTLRGQGDVLVKLVEFEHR
jgi:serine/threonine protein kinase